MIKHIAISIDNLLIRYSRHDSVSSLQLIQDILTTTFATIKTPEDNDTPIDMIVNKIGGLECNQPSQCSQAQRYKLKNKNSTNYVHFSFLDNQL